MTFFLLLSISFLIIGLFLIYSALSYFKEGKLYLFHMPGDKSTIASLAIFFGFFSIGISLFLLLVESIYYFEPYIFLHNLRGFTAICIVGLPIITLVFFIILFLYRYWKK